MARRSLEEWVANLLEGKTHHATPEDLRGDFNKASHKPPPLRTRKAMRAYAEARNRYRMKRLDEDFAWLKRMMEEMGMNPEDARYLL